jgi:glucose dehydrogenase
VWHEPQGAGLMQTARPSVRVVRGEWLACPVEQATLTSMAPLEILLMLLMVSAALMMAASPDRPATTTSLSQEQENATEKIICKREVVKGTRSQWKRICMSQRQWNRLQDATRDNLHEWLNSGREPRRQ